MGYIRVIGGLTWVIPRVLPRLFHGLFHGFLLHYQLALVATILHAIYDQKRVLNSMTKKRYKNYYLGDLRRVPVDLFAAFEACQLKPPFFCSQGLDGLGKGEQRAPGRSRGSGSLSSGLDSPGREQREPMLMQKEPQSSGLDGPRKEEQKGLGPFRGSGSGQ